MYDNIAHLWDMCRIELSHTVVLMYDNHYLCRVLNHSTMDEEKNSQEEELSFSEYRVDSYNPNKPARLSNDLFDITKSVSTLSSTHGLKLVYAIAQAVQDKQVETISGLPRINMSVQAAFDYLDLRTSNRRYELLKAAFEAVMNNSLHLVQKDSKGNSIFRGMSWISWYEFSTGKNRLYIVINPMAIPFLLQLSRYASIQPKYYNQLSTTYQLWLYPFLKNKQKMRSFKVRIDELKKLLNSDQKESYTDEMRGTNAFFKRVLGITISQAAKEENARAKKAKESPAFIPWDYVLDKSGKPTGTLYNINAHTDLMVSARGIKSGRSYEEIEFLFTPPEFFKESGAKGQFYTPDLFAEEKSKPRSKEDTGIDPREGWGWVVLSEEQVQELLNDLNVPSKEKLVAMSRYLQLHKGQVHRYMELPYFKEGSE